jgi:hypothetical protein
MNLAPFTVIWACLLMALLGIMLYRKLVMREDDYVHLADSESRAVSSQIEAVHKLDVLDRWQKILTIVTLVGAVLLGVAYLYQSWMESSKLPS